MVTIKDLKDVVSCIDSAYDNFEVVLWDYNHQRKLEWGGCHSFSKSEKAMTFAVTVPAEYGTNIFEMLREFCQKQKENGICKNE